MARGAPGSGEEAAFKPQARGQARTAAPPRVYSDQEAAAFLAGTVEVSNAGIHVLQAGEEVMYLQVDALPVEHREKPQLMQLVDDSLLAVPGIGAAFRRGGTVANIYTAIGEREPAAAAGPSAAGPGHSAGPGLPAAASQEMVLFRRGAVTWSVPVANIRVFLVLGAGHRYILSQVSTLKKKLDSTIERLNRHFEELRVRMGLRHHSKSRSPRGHES